MSNDYIKIIHVCEKKTLYDGILSSNSLFLPRAECKILIQDTLMGFN